MFFRYLLKLSIILIQDNTNDYKLVLKEVDSSFRSLYGIGNHLFSNWEIHICKMDEENGFVVFSSSNSELSQERLKKWQQYWLSNS